MKAETTLALQRAKVDTEGALRRLGGNAGIYERFLLKFLDDPSFLQAEEALLKGDWKKAEMAAHTLKGLAGNLGMTRLSRACGTVVGLLREHDEATAVSALDELREAYRQICEALAYEAADNGSSS